MSQQFSMDDYVDVAARITEFRKAYPNGSLEPWDKTRPYAIETIGDATYIVVVAAAYRGPDDDCPGVGMAYEVFPGKTPYTRGSELQNAETSAWGRAIVAALVSDTKRGVSSAQEVRNRQAEREQPQTNQNGKDPDREAAFADITTYNNANTKLTKPQLGARFKAQFGHPTSEASVPELRQFLDTLKALPATDEDRKAAVDEIEAGAA